MSNKNTSSELPEDMEVIGPGQILADGRKKKSLTQQQVAEKLNFRLTLVNDIEADKFDASLPDTYNRGYLRNYAKLVDVSVDDVITSYEVLHVAHTQQAEMQSFSKGTEKQAQNSRLMWTSYLVLVILIGLTVMWWLQGEKITEQLSLNDKNLPVAVVINDNTTTESAIIEKTLVEESTIAPQNTDDELVNNVNEALVTKSADLAQATVSDSSVNKLADETSAQLDAATVAVEFHFSGDCWVNIYDATGERIAWGIKKSGYTMSISGVAPFNVTLGKPELVDIVFDGNAIDMSTYRVGQIAKFTLPVLP